MSQVMVLAAGPAQSGAGLPLTAPMYGVIALLVFGALLGLTWTFRGSSNKHR